MATFTTEIASDSLSSDNPIHQRLLTAYYLAQPYITGHLLEVGCGEGRGIELLYPLCQSYTAVDKIGPVLDKLRPKFSHVEFVQMLLPPLQGLENDHFDCVVSFQVIEHIKDDLQYLMEIHRVLKPGGVALITTPNIEKTLTRNPWHIREYQAQQLQDLASGVFENVQVKGIAGNQKVMDYYDQNRRSVEKITRFDLLDLQHRLPSWMLKIPYDLLNRINRRRLQKGDQGLVSAISHQDYYMVDRGDQALDLFAILIK